jgi:hypothetical protein
MANPSIKKNASESELSDAASPESGEEPTFKVSGSPHARLLVRRVSEAGCSPTRLS